MSPEAADPGGRKAPRIGKYQVLGHIASGGMGAVYKARDVELDRVVALKLLSPELAIKPSMVKRFFREARAAAQLHHENIVSIYDFGEYNGSHFLALEFIDGIDLYEYICRKKKLDPAEATEFLTQAARALNHAHERGIVHRDIKPANFLITNIGGRPCLKLTDLGLARQTRDEESRVTKAGSTVGTIDYMAPEQARSSTAADIRSDIYSLGCTLYHMLSGNCPFPQGSLAEKLVNHLEREPPDIAKSNPNLPPRLVAILQKMMAKKPEDRFQTPGEILEALEGKSALIEAASGEPLKALHDLAAEIHKPRSREKKQSMNLPGSREPSQNAALKSERTVPGTPPLRPLPPRPLGQRRDEEDTPVAAPSALAAYWPYGVGCVGLVVAIILVLFQLKAGDKEPDRGDIIIKPLPPPPIVEKKKDPESTKPPAKDQTNLPGPREPGWPRLYEPAKALDLAALKAEFTPGKTNLPWLMGKESEPVNRIDICRTFSPGPGKARSLEEAWSLLDQRPAELVIHDQGPLVTGKLHFGENQYIRVRAALGFRPLICFAPAAKQEKLFSGSRASLSLENLDIVVHNALEELEGALIAGQETNLRLQNCTISQAGKFDKGFQAIRLRGGYCELNRCFFRGVDLTPILIEGGGDLLMKDSLLVGNRRPLLEVALQEPEQANLYLIRSTLAAGNQLLRVRGNSQPTPKQLLQVKAWDTILARTRPGDDADLFVLSAGAVGENMAFKPVNCLLAGWQNWLRGEVSLIPAGKLDDWHKQWGCTEGDNHLPLPWPRRFPAQAETASAADFTPHGTLACYASTSAPGMIGCPVGALPPEPDHWLQRTFEHFALTAPRLPESEMPPIPQASKGIYVGEKLDVNKMDLGKHLAKKLSGKIGPKVVLHLTGTGKAFTSPILLTQVPHLVLYFESGKEGKEPLTLHPHPTETKGAPALINLNDGKLEIIQGRLSLHDSTLPPPYLIRARGGELLLQGCTLEGASRQNQEHFISLLAIEGGKTKPEPGSLAMKDTVLASAKALASMDGIAPLRSRACAWITPGNVFNLSASTLPKHPVLWSLENNTFAMGNSLLAAHYDGESPEGPGRLVIQAANNYFLNPYPEMPPRSSLVRYQHSLLPRGLIVWQGQNNAFDRQRLHAYLTPVGEVNSKNQTFHDWLGFWSKFGERDSLLVEVGPNAKTMPLQGEIDLDVLKLPAAIRPRPSGQPVYGADLDKLPGKK